MREQRLRWFGHVLAKPQNHPIIEFKVQGKRLRGVSKKEWLGMTKTDLNEAEGDLILVTHCLAQARHRQMEVPKSFLASIAENDLIVRDPTLDDVGLYECQAISVAGMNTDTAKAFVAVAPRVELKQSKSVVEKGSSVIFECTILEGTPLPELIWFKDEKELSHDDKESIVITGKHLKIRRVRESDAGSYSCVLHNIAGRVVDVAKLAVGREPYIIPSPSIVEVDIGKEVALQCNAVGHPSSTVTWQRDTVPLVLPNYSHYTLLTDGYLLITNAQLDDQTSFTCTAKNNYGEQSKTTLVVVSGLVSPVLGHVPPEEQLIEGGNLRLSCIVVGGIPKPEIKWFREGTPIEPGSLPIVSF
ncbi:unnamed protein product [Haemonchus placei]|uniref:Ig-like domain-containing protein n=1 Tax=Haemonchus placei TaxID=6290 RepID=A0A0N4WIM6_HAEPC|nr:unnamed protein product [Haemonchus placei]